MLVPGQTVAVIIEKPVAGGRMIARVDGQVVLVGGALPGERLTIRIERVGKGVAYADTVSIDEPSPDRRVPLTDPLCGGCLYAHIAYERQLQIKALVIADAFARTGRLPLPDGVTVSASPTAGYRMRARLHYRRGRLGFFREGTHEVCDARATGQLLPASCDVLDHLEAALAGLPEGAVQEIDVAENIDASERVLHLETFPGREAPPEGLASLGGVTGVTVAGPGPGGLRALAGSVYVTDRIVLDGRPDVTIRRHVLAFFQGNRFLLPDLVAHVTGQIPQESQTVDLYAGAGLFSISAARLRGARVTAVEGDRLASEDLAVNAAAAGGVTPVHQPVEAFVRSAPPGADVVIVDPPRTGMSPAALGGVLRLRGRRVVYVSCDVATLARDARRLVDGGYEIVCVDAFDLFPNTPHVETVVTFERLRENLRTAP
jgi:23S rRNA (uracil1939-C5)-methyltransferase